MFDICSYENGPPTLMEVDSQSEEVISEIKRVLNMICIWLILYRVQQKISQKTSTDVTAVKPQIALEFGDVTIRKCFYELKDHSSGNDFLVRWATGSSVTLKWTGSKAKQIRQFVFLFKQIYCEVLMLKQYFMIE